VIPEGFVGIGVPIGTDAFIQNFVAKTCRAIIDDVEKLDVIQHGFIHYKKEGFVGIGVSIGTDAFIQNFVAKTCRAIIDDVEKLDVIQDDFIHYKN
jgi:hypothetical protein